jgi:periplasmic protein TonB
MSTPAVTNTEVSGQPEKVESILPTLFGEGYGIYEVNRRSFVASFLLEGAFIGIAILLGSWTWSHKDELKQLAAPVISLDSMPILKPDKDLTGGGGGGGNRDKFQTPKGAVPKQALTQITPPQVVPPEHPKLVAEPTVVVPPQIKLPTNGDLGNPLATITGPLSQGTGIGGGLGTGSGTGIGSGQGPGVGPGYGGGFGGGVFRVGGGVSAPRPIYDPDPDYSEEARKAHWQGTVLLTVVVGPDGKVHDAHVARTLGLGLDEKAIEAVKQWKFDPARRNGQAVAVQVNIEVNFHMY